jgi:pimeloyl-ACP methyl ester carboxylesterase
MLLPHRHLGQSGPYLLLVHGYMVDGGMFMAVEEGFLRHYRLLIPDLRGYGDAWNWPGPYTFAQRVEDLAELVTHYTSEPVWVLGYSMGGAVAQLFARRYPQLTAGLILGCTFAYKPVTALERMQQALLPRLLRLLPPASLANLIYIQVFGSETFAPEVLTWYQKALQKTRLEVLLSDHGEIFGFDSRPWLGELRFPTLVIGGTNDLIVPQHHGEMLSKGIPGAELLLYKGAGHALILTHRRPFVRDVHRFILKATEGAAQAPGLPGSSLAAPGE